jgi:hypothetical protein
LPPLAITTTTKVKENNWVTGQRLAAAGEDGWWRRIYLSLSEGVGYRSGAAETNHL